MAALILSVVGIFFTLSGALVWYTKWPNLIAGYDKNAFTNPKAAAVWTGKCLTVTGLLALCLAGGGLCFSGKQTDLYLFIAFMLGSMLTGVVMLAGIQRYVK
ncbi:DUF3784 domain-containing protein [Arsenicibacter rosenii]|uniref:DUF3784 domain-containing protein n=1 Tax=Arsenicibacter rosenii TaxID=1750698 RepID=A0A1S2VRD6_9BACT|nr:DUF3784 domain-containing protein [Arsenicibacter rosenii]OIN60368.1 hypothetical protein BLX24_05960 [Arsenicibacter rosenii]